MPKFHQSGPQFQVFSLRSPSTRPVVTSEPTATFSVVRRVHRKSRAGCLSCKARRVKCDELWPECGRCLRVRRYDGRSQISCVYERVLKNRPSSGSSHEGSDREQRPTTTSVEDGIVERTIIRSTSAEQESPIVSIRDRESSCADDRAFMPTSLRSLSCCPADQELFRHFDVMTSEGLLVGKETEHYHTNLLRLAQKHTYLRHALLSTAALHLSHNIQNPSKSLTTQHLHHLTLSLQNFQTAISSDHLPLSTSDALILTSILITIQALSTISSQDPSTSWVYATSSADPSRLDWLSVQRGTSALLDQFRPHHCAGRMLIGYQPPMLRPRPAPISSSPLLISEHEPHALPDAFFSLCSVSHDIGPRPGTNPNPYHDPLHALSRLIPLPRNRTSLMRYLHLGSRIYPPFIHLVEKNDHRALLMLAWWFGLMCQLGEEVWWCYGRARRDCWAICELLGREGSEEVRDLLGFPKMACGFDLERFKDAEAEKQGWIVDGVVADGDLHRARLKDILRAREL